MIKTDSGYTMLHLDLQKCTCIVTLQQSAKELHSIGNKFTVRDLRNIRSGPAAPPCLLWCIPNSIGGKSISRCDGCALMLFWSTGSLCTLIERSLWWPLYSANPETSLCPDLQHSQKEVQCTMTIIRLIRLSLSP